jgi:HlyD family secretion protein
MSLNTILRESEKPMPDEKLTPSVTAKRKYDSTTMSVVVAALLAAAVGLVVQFTSAKRSIDRAAVQAVPVASSASTSMIAANAQTAQPAANAAKPGAPATAPATAPGTARTQWVASAPGRLEPKGGELRIGAQSTGKLVEMYARINDKVMAGDLLARIDDEDLQARLVAADAEVSVRKRERDGETVTGQAKERRTADDTTTNAERALFNARRELDRVMIARRAGTMTDDDATKARTSVATAKDKLDAERANMRKVHSQSGMPLQTRLESALATARSELSQVETAIQRTRVRAVADGSVLQVIAKVGETVAPSPDVALLTVGDMTSLRVRAELEERDVSKVRVGQTVVVRSDAFPGRDFAGKVVIVAQALAPPRLASRGPRRPTDVDVLDVQIDIDGETPLMPGMRVDAFFAPAATAQAGAAVTK